MTGGTLVLSLGDHGVHVEVGPLHGDLGDLVSAQNASFFGEGQRGGIHKRQGLVRLSAGELGGTGTMNGTVYAIYGVTFTDPTPGARLTDDTPEDVTDDLFAYLLE